MLGAFLQFTAFLKQFELLESYCLKISSGGLLNIIDYVQSFNIAPTQLSPVLIFENYNNILF